MITIIYGTRPEAIKLAPLVRELRKRHKPVTVVCTGQHRELLGAVTLTPDIELDLMHYGQRPETFLARALEVLDVRGADLVVVQGDTVSAFAGALAAFHRGIPVGHVEAGLRTHRFDAPFPEEGYRQMIDRVAAKRWAPTKHAKQQLLLEGLSSTVTGNTGIDAALQAVGGTSAGTSPYMLVTLHRREAFGEPIAAVCRAILRIVRQSDLTAIVPVHPNGALREHLQNEPKVKLVSPLSYEDLLATLKDAELVLTDSGGIQEEAPIFGVHALVARETTERPEGVSAGVATLVGFDEERIVQDALDVYDRGNQSPQMIYGDGHASERIADDI
jgi:UDP-N-acetylglucosamine 2-epimerase (non-hydrolysing)